MPDIELLLDCQAAIGESPTWCADEKAIYWIDVKEPALHRLGADGRSRCWVVDADIGAFALLEDATGAVLALRTGIVHLDFSTEKTDLLARPPFDQSLFRFNEGICDAEGRFWVGVMFDPLPGIIAEKSTAPMHCFTFADGLRAASDQSDLHNGFAWTPSGDAFYWSHSTSGRVFRAEYDQEAGIVGAKVDFSTISGQGCLPDGAAVDEEGCYWCAVHGGSVLQRYDTSGNLLSRVALPISQPTMCAFVGAGLDEMVVTSARNELTSEQLMQEPLAGGLFRFRPGVRGVTRNCVVR